MLYSLLLVAMQGKDTLAKFEDFWKRTNSFSVQIAATSLAAGQGKGALIVVKPHSLRATMKWQNEDYAYVKSPQGSTEFERLSEMYMQFPSEPGLQPYASAVAAFQQEALVTPLLVGSLKTLIPPSATLSSADAGGGSQTVTATWTDNDGGNGKVVAKIASDGKLLALEQVVESRQGAIHRQFQFSNYTIPAKVTAGTFSLIPPIGFTQHHRTVEYLAFAPGDRPKLGTWMSAKGKVQLDSAVRGKLLVVREPESKPAERLMSYLKTQKLPVKLVVASLGRSGGDFWGPSAQTASSLTVVGTPLSILVGKDGVVQAMWVGFDFDNPGKMLKEMKEALEENSEE